MVRFPGSLIKLVKPQIQKKHCWFFRAVEQWRHRNFPIRSMCALWTWRRHLIVSLGVFSGGAPGVWDTYSVVTTHLIPIQTEGEFGLPGSKSGLFWWQSAFIRATLCSSLCSKHLWTEFLGTSKVWSFQVHSPAFCRWDCLVGVIAPRFPALTGVRAESERMDLRPVSPYLRPWVREEKDGITSLG